MSGPSPPKRCKYTFPEDHDFDTLFHSNCCWREVIKGKDRCIWHADPDEVGKSAETLRDACAPTALRNQTSPFDELLDGANLSGIKLGNTVLFENVALRNADFSSAGLRGADFSDANLLEVDFSGAFLGRATLSGAELRESDLTDAYLREADLSGADLRGADLSGADLGGADLSEADLKKADLPEADLKKADLSGADLGGADLTDADLRESDLTDANLRDADLTEADLVRANLSGANLSGTDLTDADFTSARLISADLRRADFTGAIFNHADLSEADLRGAVLEGSFLDDAILTDIKTRGSRETQKAAERSIDVYNSIRRIFILGLVYSIAAIIGVLYLERFGYLSDIGLTEAQLSIILSLFLLFIYGSLARRFIELQSTAERVVKVDDDG